MDKDDLLEQVKSDISKYRLLEKGDAVVAGISGGADSTCLLRVLKELQSGMDLKIHAVHVNHGLRGREADEDQKFVEEICAQWDIPLETFKADIKSISRERGISTEEAGREERYRLFGQVLKATGANKIAVAHQKEDQAETVMLHILRGTGIDGLCGMNIIQGNIIRPLLNVSRRQIIRFLDQNNISYRIDSTNLDSDYTRNRIRNRLFPDISEMFMINPAVQLLRLSEIMREDRDFLNDEAQKAYNIVKTDNKNDIGISVGELLNYHPAIIKRIIRLAWEKINKNRKNLEQVHVEQVFDLCLKNQTGKRVVLPNKIEARISYGQLIFSKRPEEIDEGYYYDVKTDGMTIAERAGGALYGSILPAKEAFERYGDPDKLKENSLVQLFDYDKLCGGINLRNRQPGDRIRPYGSSGEKKLKEYFIDKKIPRENRFLTPLIACNDRIAWIIGMRTSQEFKANRDTETILVLEWRNLKE
jgi:tRNA(Ile)-lysidine synthase